VAANDLHILVEGQQLAVDAGDDLLWVRSALQRGDAGPRCPTDGAPEQSVAGATQLLPLEIITHRARRVPRAMQASQRQIWRPLDDVAVGQERIGWRQWRRRKVHTEVPALLVNSLVQAEVALVHEDVGTRRRLQLRCSQDVIQMSMRYQYPLTSEAVLAQLVQDVLDVPSGVNNARLLGDVVSDDGAVATQRGNDEDLDDGSHGEAWRVRPQCVENGCNGVL